MPSWKTLWAGCLTLIAILIVAGGCVTSFVLFGQAMEQEAKPNSALVALAITIVVASVLFIAARALSRDPEE